jgi:hypothetical protein
MKSMIFLRSLPCLFALSLALFSCKNETAEGGKAVEEIATEGKISSIIRSPINSDGTVDTSNVAKMTFETSTFDFGEVKEGEIVKHVFKFTNTGKVPLIINNARSTCGCTVPKWPREAIPPGASGEIAVDFNTKAKVGDQEKPITISANTFPANTQLYLKGFVHPEAGR